MIARKVQMTQRMITQMTEIKQNTSIIKAGILTNQKAEHVPLIRHQTTMKHNTEQGNMNTNITVIEVPVSIGTEVDQQMDISLSTNQGLMNKKPIPVMRTFSN